jgi:cytochrome P450 family 110
MNGKIPPGPKGKWLPTLSLIRNPRQALEGWAKEFGDPFLLSALNGRVVVTGREDLIRTIHGQDPGIYEPFATATIAPLIGARSMFVLSGETHRRERRLLNPMFSGDRMKAYGPAMQEISLRQLAQYRKKETVSTQGLMTDISLEIIVQTIFGGGDPEMCSELMKASRRLVGCASPLLFFSRKTHLPCFGVSPWDRWRREQKNLFHLFDTLIDARLSAGKTGEDILSLLCTTKDEDGKPLSREHIHSELLTFLFAGHETTALTLTWAIYHIHRNPAVLRSLQDELDALPDLVPATLAAAPYLKATIQETLRIHPLVTETLRKLKSPLQLGEYTIPAGIAVAPATVLAHHSAANFENPESFRPERFLENDFSPFVYMPFGGGHRRCIGAAFASYEMAMVLGSLLKRFSIELLDSQPVVPKRRSVTMGPSSDVPVRVRDR